ncbi:hypothetical protein E2C01_097861 [Portunus trituberculatus]|uniref:Secreted protein n=1 Tax=Portunus trituberculatus TaxID=210409 RepID=A0A5B7K5Z0_PORTR|nr:hypothetical protein [Portunus trituberculatus]
MLVPPSPILILTFLFPLVIHVRHGIPPKSGKKGVAGALTTPGGKEGEREGGEEGEEQKVEDGLSGE